MERWQKNKKIWLIVGGVLLLMILILVGLKSCSKDETADKGIKETEKEIQIEEKESEDGLDVSGPEDADSEDSEGTVDFIGPDDVADGKDQVTENESTTNDNTSSENVANDGGNDDVDLNEGDNGSNNDKSESKDNVGNLDETDDNSSGGYGEFF